MSKGETKTINRKSAIEQTSLINEIIKRENKFHSINTVFTLNLKRLYNITEKPNSMQQDFGDMNLRTSGIPQNITDKIKYYFKTPNEKYENPLTSSHEFGWHSGEKLNRNSRRHPKIGCDVTRYADEYYAMKRQSPYAIKQSSSSSDKK